MAFKIGMKDFGTVGASAAAVTSLAGEMLTNATTSAATTTTVLPAGSEAASIRASESQRGYATDFHLKLSRGIDMINQRGAILADTLTDFQVTDAEGGAGVSGVDTAFS